MSLVPKTKRFGAPGTAVTIGALVLVACASGPDGLRGTPPGSGPMIVVDWDAEPLPELPFPNDLATRPDPGSVTGLRVNISEHATTEEESHAREKLNELVGWGIFSPISVQFDHRLDLDNVLDRHPDDFYDPSGYDDDAFYVINVDPGSPQYLQAVALDVGHGRFPMDVAQTDQYFDNDPRSWSPSLMFELADEDLNGNGRLDWGEDTDNDGVLDIPNVYPEGGDPRDDLLTWYDLESDTLLLRPVVPLLEETRYAVVLTERLTDEQGEPVRSPWPFVNHARQTTALMPVLDALPAWDLGVDDVAYAWVFTTGRVTGDLVDIRRGFDGEGPFDQLERDYPPAITEALQLHERSNTSWWRLPISDLMTEINTLDLLGDDGEVFAVLYEAFASDMVAGVYETPYLLADRDDGGEDDSDEWWQLDPMTGALHAAPQRVPFTCILPKPGPDVQQPYPVAVIGHGYGSSRFEMLGFAHVFNQRGWAVCGGDHPGHGPTVSPDEDLLASAVFQSVEMLSFYNHLKDSRYRDLNNDGLGDSGGDQWTADAFHTRDMVRQAAVDWMQMVRSLKTCGETEWEWVEEPVGGAVGTGTYGMSCDWNEDGVPDIGGPDVDYVLTGGSLGGMNASVAIPVMPELAASSPIVPGGGVLDIAMRTNNTDAVEAMVGRLLTPMFVGHPTDSGGLDIVQVVNSVTDMVDLHVATLDEVPAGGRIELENRMNGETRIGFIPEDGRLRLSIPADALDATGKRLLTGMPRTGPAEGDVFEVPDNAALGDLLVVRIFDASDTLVAEIDTFEEEVVFEGVTMRAGSPLIAGARGSGHIRGTPKLRKLAIALAAALEPGDPISYAPHWFSDPFEILGGEPANVLVMPTPGDENVNISTGIALARAAGLVDYTEIDDRYGTTVDRFLIDHRVVQGLEEFGPYTDGNGNPALFDADDLDDGTDGLGAPSAAPLRSTRTTSAGVSGLRLPYIQIDGSHGMGYPDSDRDFDINMFSVQQMAAFLASGGTELSDARCLETADCPGTPSVEDGR